VGGYRTLSLYRAGERAVFAFGFAKNGIGNIDARDEARLKSAAELTLGLADLEIGKLVEACKCWR
jgi:hypothetical protein